MFSDFWWFLTANLRFGGTNLVGSVDLPSGDDVIWGLNFKASLRVEKRKRGGEEGGGVFRYI